MHFTSALLAFVAVASAIPSQLAPRATDLSQQILANITVLIQDGINLNNTINAQPAGNTPYTTTQLVAIAQANDKLSKDLNSTSATANASSIFTQSESQAIYNRVNNDVKPVIFSDMDNLIAHYGNIKSIPGNFVPVVKSSLQSERELTRELSNALIVKFVAPYNSQGSTLRDQLLAKFDAAITKYSS